MSYQCRVSLQFFNSAIYLYEETDGTTLADIIHFCARVHIVEEDGSPSYACSTCGEDAKRAFAFVQKCRQSDKELRAPNINREAINTASENVVEATAKTQELVVEVLTDQDEINNQLLQIEMVEEQVDRISEHSYSAEESSPDNQNVCAVEYLYEETANMELNDYNAMDFYCCHEDCLLTFNTKEVLKNHILLKHPVEQYNAQNTQHRCDNCDRAFGTAEEQTTHQAVLHLKQSTANISNRVRTQTRHCIFTATEKKCCDCYESFPTVEALLKHATQRHSIRKAVHDPARPVRCEVCFKLFRCLANLNHHQSVPYQPRRYSCNMCAASFRTSTLLATHEISHSTERKYVCEKCGTCFKNNQNLKMHCLLHEEKREVCKTCGLRFHRKSNLRIHERVHSNTYYAVCPHCDKQYKTQSQLQQHMKVHTQERLLACRYCAKRFMYTSDRKRHEMTHTGVYPFVCGCSRKFSRSRLYTRHVATQQSQLRLWK
uniref:Protein krueppel n=1 Tax=Anopheles christyi TaxID=43041 RepID=A0A182JUH1_9DIPT